MTKASGGNEAVKVCITAFKFHANCNIANGSFLKIKDTKNKLNWGANSSCLISVSVSNNVQHISYLYSSTLMDFHDLQSTSKLFHIVLTATYSSCLLRWLFDVDRWTSERLEWNARWTMYLPNVYSTCGYICLSCITQLKFYRYTLFFNIDCPLLNPCMNVLIFYR